MALYLLYRIMSQQEKRQVIMLEEDKEMHALGEQYMKDKLSGVINSQSLFIDQLSVNTNLFEQKPFLLNSRW